MKTYFKKPVLLLLIVIMMFPILHAQAATITTNSITETSAATTTSTNPTQYSGSFAFTVKGYGHGVGMSQKGAIAYANQNWNYDNILLHYYQPGVTIVDDSSPPESVNYAGKSYPLQEYLARAVAQEIGTGSPVEALKAQAVATYTYAKVYSFTLNSSQSAFSFSFNMDPNSNVIKAVNAVIGKYLSHSGKPIAAFYFASSAGQTVSSASVWGGSIPYLGGGVVSPETVAVSNRTYTVNEFKALVDSYNLTCGAAKVITLQNNPAEWLKIISADSAGYVNTIRVGNREMSGNNFRYSLLGLGIKSHSFTSIYTGGTFPPEKPTLSASPATPTFDNVTVSITCPAGAINIEFKVGEGSWSAYAEPVVLLNNATIYAKYTDDAGQTSDIGSLIVNNIVQIGDVNSDNAITSVDALMALQAAARNANLDEAQILASDINNDGKVSSLDSLKILQYAAGLITDFN